MSTILDGYEAMGTKFWVEVYDTLTPVPSPSFGEGRSASDLGDIVVEILKDFEKKYSRFDPNSLLNQYNRGEVKHEDLDDEFKDIIEKSHHFMDISDKVFDIYIQDKLIEKGYGSSFTITPNPPTVSHTVGVRFAEGSHSIDLGGIGKGYVIDKIATLLKEKYNIKYFLINGGGDMYMTSDNGNAIEIYMQHPTKPDEYIETVSLMNRAFCASSSFVRTWDNKNHFITPDGGEVWAASYIVGDDATTSDVAATIACILSLEKDKLATIMNKLNVKYYVLNQKGEINSNMI